MAARCETVLNTTMAEMDTYHNQKLEDFQELAKEHLDGEIALYEQVRLPRTPFERRDLIEFCRFSVDCAPLVKRLTSHSTTNWGRARDNRRSTSASSNIPV